MGLLDHRRGWHYEVAAPPAECIRAFAVAFNGKGGLVAKARWSIRATKNAATATYEGRKGLGAVGGFVSKTSSQEADTAIGSQVNTMDLRDFSSAWPRDLAFYAGLEVEGDSR
ncbi:MAG: hypothetical protein ACRDN0_10305 [Trebonia sp.]